MVSDNWTSKYFRDDVMTLIERVEAFIEHEVGPLEEHLADALRGTRSSHPELDDHGRMAAAVWDARRQVRQRSAAAGLYAMHMSERCGGRGVPRAEMMLVEEAVFRAGVGLAPAMLAWTEGPSPMLNYASDHQVERFVEPLVRGETTAAFANTEPSGGSDVLNMKTTAIKDGDEWVINGHKAWITNAPFCDVIQVIAVAQPGAGSRSLTAFFVEADRDGVRRGTINPTLMDDGLTGEIVFDGVRVPDANRLGDDGAGLALAMTWINWRRMCRGGMCAGWNRLLLDRAVARVQAREAFGKPLAERQAVQHTLAAMELDRYTARAASLEIQRRLDQLGPYDIPLDPEARGLMSLIKYLNDQAFYRVADRAVQLHGAAGLRRNSTEEKLFRVARNLRIPAGADEIQLDQIARGLLASPADVPPARVVV
jgi:alkylation response protein AidB-like acyl-CoA dehydrogenase